VLQQFLVDAGLKGEKSPGPFDAVAFAAFGDGAQGRFGEPVEGVVAGKAVQLRMCCDAHGEIPGD